MYCNQCGAQSPAEARFCSGCGIGIAALAVPVGASAALAGTVAHPAANAAPRSGAPQVNRDIEAWRAFLGPKNLDYYLPRFERIANGGSARWHWPALFLTWYWLLYRKMYVYALLYMVAPYVLSLPIGLAIGMLGGSEATTQMTVGVLTLIFILAPPFIANQLYFRHAQKHIKQLATTIKSRDAYLAALSAKGGTSSVAVAIITVAVLVSVLGILAAVAIPAYSEYMRRAENAQATVYGKKVALEVLDRYSATHVVETSPSVLKSLGPGQIPAAVRSVEIGAQDGAVTVVTKNGGTLVMTPYSNGKLGCSSPDIPVKLLPRDCRQATMD